MTNKTKLSAAALFSALVLGGSFAGSTVFAAAQPGPKVEQGFSENSVSEQGHAYVTFTKEGTNPVHDPSDPNKSDNPSNPSDITGETGELTLDAIPSSLNFGTQEATGAGQVVQLLSSDAKAYYKDGAATKNASGDDKRDGATLTDGTTAAPVTSDHSGDSAVAADRVIFTQVTNVATTNPTWKLSATMSGFNNGTDKDALKGAFITFGGGVNVLDKYDDTTGKETWAATSDQFTTGAKLTAADPNGVTFVSSAATGTFQQQWNVGDVTLTTPNAPSKGSYTSDINWTLTASPAEQTTDPAAGTEG